MRFFVIALSLAASFAEPVVDSSLGRITGVAHSEELGSFEIFLGIPYAKPPVGHLRFELPEAYGPVANFTADDERPGCTQELGAPFSKEDCLHLNVFRREGTQPSDGKAVVVVIHGGYFARGSALIIDVKPLVAIADVIAITLNYRLGIFGFVNFGNLAPGNVGLFDQRLALEWVKENVRAFGGDPDRITIAGFDAGAASIHAHIATPLNRGRKLFHAAFMDAGFLGNGLEEETRNSLPRVRKIAVDLNCPAEGRAMLECLRNVSASQLNEAQHGLGQSNKYYTFQPTIDGVFIPKHIDEMNTDEFLNVKLIVGVAKDEGSFFIDKEKQCRDPPNTENEFLEFCAGVSKTLSLPTNFSDPDTSKRIITRYFKEYRSPLEGITHLITDSGFICPASDFVEKYARHNRSVFMYYFERQFKSPYFASVTGSAGAFHGTPFTNFMGVVLGESFLNSEDKQFSRAAVDLISGFAKTDRVPELLGVQWPDFSLTEKVLRINDNATVDALPRKQNCRGIF